MWLRKDAVHSRFSSAVRRDGRDECRRAAARVEASAATGFGVMAKTGKSAATGSKGIMASPWRARVEIILASGYVRIITTYSEETFVKLFFLYNWPQFRKNITICGKLCHIEIRGKSLWEF